MDSPVILVNTHDSCRDVWPMFFGQLEKHYPNQKVYVLTNSIEGLPTNVVPLVYSEQDSYRTQYLKGIQQVQEKYCISLNEDYILYSDVLKEEIAYCVRYLEEHEDMAFVRLHKGTEYNEPKIEDKLYLLNNNNMWFFSQVAGIWRTRELERIHEESPESGMAFKVPGPQLELVANNTCKRLGTKGVFYYNGEAKRGACHYDSSVFPYVASALVKGKWNLREYPSELGNLMVFYGLDPSIRGIA